ncbi:Phycobilisome rod-core linker polypeptide CpcG [Acaryochloris thomasi RCC1774]|uniref:Phycobilisome rod-core linker polypeptide CpcG n=1 Tax=Acaryochloris thomasi RCC1774 TaxID=1764569 RepID=A0A2W1JKQ1_9CYAN|nr:phycobilisome rod-core linker polypeptide [Acaryochloris thomasi]PZD70774.1 Phycobilisome rod-core linker polypeptide CpcG [Acaryochloris thomasi RCC1774]
MPLPLLEYSPTSQNTRVSSRFDVPGDEQPRVFSTDDLFEPSDIETLIEAAYLQLFHEQQMLDFNRQTTLESQLKTGQITVKDFIRGLATSDSFRRLNFDVNNNYRFSELCVQRILGRQVYSDRETIAWSIVLANKGLNGFINALLESDEYLDNFGEYTVPYQRRRVLQQRAEGEVTFAHMPRYGTDYRNQQASAERSNRSQRSAAKSKKKTTTRILNFMTRATRVGASR